MLPGSGESKKTTRRQTEGLLMKMRQVCGFDHHLESQAMALSTPIHVPGASVKLDFIGKIEHLVHGFMTMLQLAQAKTGLSVDRNLGITTQGCLSMMVSMLSCRYSPIVFKILARLSPKN